MNELYCHRCCFKNFSTTRLSLAFELEGVPDVKTREIMNFMMKYNGIRFTYIVYEDKRLQNYFRHHFVLFLQVFLLLSQFL